MISIKKKMANRRQCGRRVYASSQNFSRQFLAKEISLSIPPSSLDFLDELVRRASWVFSLPSPSLVFLSCSRALEKEIVKNKNILLARFFECTLCTSSLVGIGSFSTTEGKFPPCDRHHCGLYLQGLYQAQNYYCKFSHSPQCVFLPKTHSHTVSGCLVALE